MKHILTSLIRFIHMCVLIFIIIAPFSHNSNIIIANILLMSFILYGWILSAIDENIDKSNTHRFGRCSLTELEHKIRGGEYKDGFILSLIKPFKTIDDATLNYILIIFLISWLIINFIVLKLKI